MQEHIHMYVWMDVLCVHVGVCECVYVMYVSICVCKYMFDANINMINNMYVGCPVDWMCVPTQNIVSLVRC